MMWNTNPVNWKKKKYNIYIDIHGRGFILWFSSAPYLKKRENTRALGYIFFDWPKYMYYISSKFEQEKNIYIVCCAYVYALHRDAKFLDLFINKYSPAVNLFDLLWPKRVIRCVSFGRLESSKSNPNLLVSSLEISGRSPLSTSQIAGRCGDIMDELGSTCSTYIPVHAVFLRFIFERKLCFKQALLLTFIWGIFLTGVILWNLIVCKKRN